MPNIKLAFRILFRTPFVTTVAVLSLALGIGANAAIFSLANQILLKPLPVPHPERLINLTAPGPNPGWQSCGQAGNCREIFSYPMFKDLERQQTVLTGLAGHVSQGVNLAVNGAPMSGTAMLVSGSYFRTLEITPVLGRLIADGDEVLGADQVAVLSHAFWNTHFAADRHVVGQTIVVDGTTLTIIGVAPRGFDGTTLGITPEVFAPITIRKEFSGFDQYQSRTTYWIYLFGRLKPGVTAAQARTALNAIYTPILQNVEAPLQDNMSAATMQRFKAKLIGVNPGYHGQSQLQHEATTPLAMLFGVTAVVLLIACANIANLLLARGANRSMEMGMRLALGAPRRRLIGQMLTESVILALMGGVASLAVAALTLKLLASLLPGEITTALHFSLQPNVLLFAGALAVGTGLLFGLFPALHNARTELIGTIRSNTGQIAGHKRAGRFRATLVTAQIALATGLLISAGLFLKSLVNVSRVNLGVQVNDVVTFSMAPERSGYDSARAVALYRRITDVLSHQPGVSAVTSSMVPLIAGSNWGNSVWVQGYPSGPDVDRNSRFNAVGPGYFSTLGIPILAGRGLTASDVDGAPRVVVVNEAFATKFHLGRNPVGTFMSQSGPDSLNIQIVGLARDAKYADVKDSVPPVFFVPWQQSGDPSALYFYLRSGLAPGVLLRDIPPILKRLAPTVPVENLRSMPEQVRQNTFEDRMMSILSALFASLATLLAAVGLYGVLAYTVQQRTREIGVRMALGADAARVRSLVLKQVGVMIAIGGVIGLGAAIAVGRLMHSLLYGMGGTDPVVLVGSTLLLAIVALAASYVPVLRASRVDPVEALRFE
ncbi:MAG TPA: ABC transporter permease [Gemmatimonadales bacterium]|nr:ABC transporter permease [Gemmatimonadales bacterium]